MSETPSAGSRSGRHLYLYTAVFLASFGGFLFGYDTAVISGAIIYIKQQMSLSSGMEELIISSLFLSAMVGAPLGGTLADRLGRKKVLVTAGILFAAGSLVMAFAFSVWTLVSGRIVTGLALGMVSVTSPVYISEISSPGVRGRLVSYNVLAITLGTMLSYLADYLFSYSKSWRWMIGLEVVPALVLAFGMLLMSETPRWLAAHSLREKAGAVLRRLRCRQDVDAELTGMESGASGKPGGWRDLLDPSVRPVLLLGIGLAVFRSFAGFSVVLYGYAPTIVERSGVETASIALLATAGIGVVNTLMTIIVVPLIDRVGRRPLMLTGLAGLFLSLAILGTAFVFPRSEEFVKWLAIASLLLYIGSFSLGPRPVFWVLISEIYPQRIRGKAMSVGSLANWGANFLVTLTFLTLTQLIGRAGAFFLYAAFAAATGILFYFLVPETSGRSLEDIEKKL